MITIDNMEPRLVAGLVGTAPYCRFEIEGQNELPPEDISLQDWWNNELQDIVKIEDVAGDVCHDVQLDGTVFVLPRYSVEETTRRMMRMVDPQKIQQAVQQLQKLSQVPPEQMPPEVQQQAQALNEVVNAAQNNINGIVVGKDGRPMWTDQKVKLFEGGKVDFLKLSDVFMPDDVDDDNYEDAPILRYVYPTYADLMRDSRDDSQTGWLPKNITPRLIGDLTEEEKLPEDAQSPAQAVGMVEVSGKQVIRCLECYISYMYRKEHEREEDATDFTEERVVALIAEDSKLLIRLRLLREINPQNQHMVRRQTLFRERGCSYGTTVYHKMKSIQDGATRSFNLAINTGDVQLLPWGFYDGKSGLDKLKGDKGSIQLGVGKFLKVDDVNGIKFPTMNGNPAGFMSFLSTWMQFWEKAFNIGEMQIGVERTGASETATASLAKIQEGNIAHGYRGKRSKAGFLGVIQTLVGSVFRLDAAG